MQDHHKLTRNSLGPCQSRPISLGVAEASVNHAHLRRMETVPPIHSVSDDLEGLEPAFSLKELADLFGVTVQALYDLRSQGRGPIGFRVGRQLRFRRSEVSAWLGRMEAEDIERHPHRVSR